LAAAGRVEILPGATNRETTVRLAARSGRFMVVDLGHQSIQGRLVDLERSASFDVAVPLRAGKHHSQDLATVGRIVSALTEAADVGLDDVTGIGATFHAPLDADGVVSQSSIMPDWAGINPAEKLSSYLGKEITVENDANAAALAEWAWGAGRGSRCFVYAKTSRGIGAGVVLDGDIFRGATGTAGEIGHLVVDSRGPLCNCGNRGCLSAVASGHALLAQFQTLNDRPKDLHDLVDRAIDHDPVASRVLAEAGRHLGVALAHVISVLGPDRIVIGGELARAGAIHLGAVTGVIEERTVRFGSVATEIVRARLEDSPSVLGGLISVMRANQREMSAVPPWFSESNRISIKQE
jgi:predicted NBD/HSP70 family sugar kinase